MTGFENEQTVEVVEGRRNDLTGDWDAEADQFEISGCLIAPAGTTETSARTGTGAQVATRVEIYAPAACRRPSTTARIRMPGETGTPHWQVLGDAADWGVGTVITVERVTG